jgi:hypothetical protein
MNECMTERWSGTSPNRWRTKVKIQHMKSCKLYEKLSMLRPRSSNRTQLRLHSHLLLRFRDMHVPYHVFPPLRFSCEDIVPTLGLTTGLAKKK